MKECNIQQVGKELSNSIQRSIIGNSNNSFINPMNPNEVLVRYSPSFPFIKTREQAFLAATRKSDKINDFYKAPVTSVDQTYSDAIRIAVHVPARLVSEEVNRRLSANNREVSINETANEFIIDGEVYPSLEDALSYFGHQNIADIVQSQKKYLPRHYLEENGFSFDPTVEELMKVLPEETIKSIDAAKKVNPNIEFTITTNSISQFYSSGRINIDIEELYSLSMLNKLPFQEVLNTTVLHELEHAATVPALNKTGIKEELHSLFEEVKTLQKTNPFDDKFRFSWTSSKGLPYTLSSIYEFYADANSNPYFIEYLKSISSEKKTLYQKFRDFVNKVLSSIGLGNSKVDETMYDRIVKAKTESLNLLNKEEENIALSDSGQTIQQFYAANNTFSEMQALLEEDTIMEKFKANYPKLVKELREIRGKLYSEEKTRSIENIPERKQLTSVLDSFKNIEENENHLKVLLQGLFSVSNIFESLSQKATLISKEPDSPEKLVKLYSISEVARENEDYIKLMSDIAIDIDANDIIDEVFVQKYVDKNKSSGKSVEELRQEGNKQLKNTEKAIKRILSVPIQSNEKIKRLVAQQAPKLLIAEAYEFVSGTQKERKATIDKDIDKAQKELATETSVGKQLALKDKVAKLEKERTKLILPENNILENTLTGQEGDIGYFNLMLESATMSKDPFSAILSAKFKNTELDTNRAFQAITNDAQTALEKLQAATKTNNISVLDTYRDKLMDEVTVYDSVKFNPETKEYEIKSHLQKALVSQLSTEYYRDYNLFVAKKDALESAYYSSKTEEEDKPIIKEELDRVFREFNDFREKNTQRRYKDEVYKIYKLQDEVLEADGTKTTHREYTQNLYRDRDAAQEHRDAAGSVEEFHQNQDVVTQLNVRIKGLEDETGKTGIDLLVAKQSQKIKELNRKYKETTLTQQSKDYWAAQRENKRITLGENYVEFKTWDQENSVSKPPVEYFNAREEIYGRLKEARKALVDKGTIQDKENNNWDTLLKIARKARDNSGIIDGNLLSDEEIKAVKDVEELELQLKDETTGISSLSKKEYARLKELTDNDDRTTAEGTELKTLQDKRKELGKNKKLPQVESYLKILKELGELTTSEETFHYTDKVSQEKGAIAKGIEDSQEHKDQMDKIRSGTEVYEKGNDISYRYDKDTNKWYEDRELTDGNIQSVEFPDAEQAILNHKTEQEYTKSEWFTNNHIEKTVFVNGKYVNNMVPIYIWTQKIPNQVMFGQSVFEAGYNYYSSKIKDEYVNQDYGTTTDYIPFPKSEKYQNKKYQEIQKNKTLKEFYDFVTPLYLNSQVEGKKLGYLLPSGRKLEIEDLKGIASGNVKDNIKEHFTRMFTSTEQDIDLIGATSDNAHKKIIPTKLSSRIEASEQTDDILGNILQYVYYAERKKAITGTQAFAETLYNTLAEYDKTSIVTRSEKLNLIGTIRNAVKGIPNNVQSKAITQTGVESNRTKSVRELTDKMLYGQMNKGQELKIGPFNLTKVTGGLLGITAKAIFAWNIFSPLKNTIGAGVQQIIEANGKLGYFSEVDLAWAQREVLVQSKNLAQDSFKVGNKSLIGQMFDRFDAITGHTYNHLGRKTTWNALVKAPEFLQMALIKEGSEYNLQATQFLSIMKHTIVKDRDGKNTSLYQAYEIKNGTISLKEGITKQDGSPFTTDDENRLIRKIQKVNLELNGAYRLEEKNNSEKYLAGKVLNFMSQYLVSGLNRRYMKERFIEQDGSFQEGYYRSAWRFLVSNFAKYKLNVAANWSSLTNAEKANVTKFMKELSIMLILFSLIWALGGGDDDRFEKSQLQMFTLALAKGSLAEAQTFSPINGTDDMLRRVQNPFVVSRTLQNMWRLAAHTGQTIYGDDAAYYTQNGNGHKKGDSKAIADLMKLSGMSTSNVFFGTGEELLKRQESILQLR